MRITIISFIILLLFACNNTQEHGVATSESADLAVKREDSIEFTHDGDTISDTANNCDCVFSPFLKNPKTPQIAKDIYLDQQWDINNSSKELLALLDSLNAKDERSRAFYFKVLIKSKKKADGYYSEGLGNAAYNYVMNHTSEFAGFFDNQSCFTDHDLEIWAEITSSELKILSEEDNTKQVLSDFTFRIKLNCKDCSSSRKLTILNFCRMLEKMQ